MHTGDERVDHDDEFTAAVRREDGAIVADPGDDAPRVSGTVEVAAD